MGQVKTPLGQRVYSMMKRIRGEILNHCSTVNFFFVVYYTSSLGPHVGVQRGCIVYCAEGINGATVIENLSPDMFHRPVDSLTKEWIHLSRRRGAR